VSLFYDKYNYDTFGKMASESIETISNPFKYVGRYGLMDDENSLLYMRARYYDPEIGRFINKDPIGWVGGFNMYAYVGNNPIMLTDPKGLACGGGWSDPAIPDVPSGIDFTKCCKEHDKCYEGSEIYNGTARWKCDLLFLNCMVLECGNDPTCNKVATIYKNTC